MIDSLSLILIVIGAAVTYGSKYLVRILRLGQSENKIVLVKTIGFLIVVLGMLRLFEII